MKLLHVNSYFGTNALHRECLVALNDHGIVQDVFFPVALSEVTGRDVERIGSARVFKEGCFREWYKYVWPLKMLLITFRLIEHCRREGVPDLVHAHTVISNGLPALVLKWIYGVPFVVTVRNTDTDFFFSKSAFFRWLGLAVLRRAAKVIVLTPIYKTHKLKCSFSSRDLEPIEGKMEVIPNAIADDWHASAFSGQKVVNGAVAFVGRLDENKNLALVIDAIRLLCSEGLNLRLEVVGDGPTFLDSKARSVGLNVTFHGRLSCNEKIREVLRKADLLAVPSHRETFGLVYVEGMSQGLPVIYTKGQGFDGVFEDGYVGFAVDSNSVSDVAQKIRDVYSKYSEISERAAFSSKAYSWTLIAAKLSELYGSVLGNDDVRTERESSGLGRHGD